jgi:hypothetical protein
MKKLGKKLGFLMWLLATALTVGGTALGQDNSVFFTTYFSNANTAGAPDATVRIVNDGNQYGSHRFPNGNILANIYVFDDSEELTECCSCNVTPDGVLSESVNLNLTANPLTGHKPTRGVIKVKSPFVNIFCVPGFCFTEYFPGLRVWATHVQGTKVTLSPGNAITPVVTGPYFVTETPAADSNLSGTEETLLDNLCQYDQMLSGQPCTCQPEDYDF